MDGAPDDAAVSRLSDLTFWNFSKMKPISSPIEINPGRAAASHTKSAVRPASPVHGALRRRPSGATSLESVAALAPRPRAANLPGAAVHAGQSQPVSRGLADALCLDGGAADAPVLHAGGMPALGPEALSSEQAAAPAQAGALLLRPERLARWRRSLREYTAIEQAASGASLAGAAKLSLSDESLTLQIRQGVAELNVMLSSLEALPADNAAIQQARQVMAYARKDLGVRMAAQQLTMQRADLVIPRLPDYDSLDAAADGLRVLIGRDAALFQSRTPEVLHYLRQLDHGIRGAAIEARAVAQLQAGILGTLRDAVQGFADADIERVWSSPQHWWAHLAGRGDRHGSERVDRIQGKLHQAFGNWLSIQRSGDFWLKVSIRPEALGKQSCADLLKSLEHMLHTLGTRRDRAAVNAAISASPDVIWVDEGGAQHLDLAAQARDRVGAGGTSAAALVPHADLQAAVMTGASGIKLSVLKVSLVESFRDRVDRLHAAVLRSLPPFPGWDESRMIQLKSEGKAGGLTLKELAQAEVQVAKESMSCLMESPEAGEMLRILDGAINRHRKLRFEAGLCREGPAATLLDEMRDCVQRYSEQSDATAGAVPP